MAPWIDSAAARGTKLLEALSEQDRHTVPNLILLSFRRTIMPKGSFFPRPTKTPTIQETCDSQARRLAR